ncbi:uncharacterized protein LOC112552842 [Pogonomyrmex barbatus]|uniref:Uncharacterized protein LOC112552842 n=1 Tax=Pogonomyrmex barbatus TaxID=144034 RepID=A0A8N1S7T5_9HYME|nr:uncharacterized protein LOC112552842 [Pogonomyrmex barbatus]
MESSSRLLTSSATRATASLFVSWNTAAVCCCWPAPNASPLPSSWTVILLVSLLLTEKADLGTLSGTNTRLSRSETSSVILRIFSRKVSSEISVTDSAVTLRAPLFMPLIKRWITFLVEPPNSENLQSQSYDRTPPGETLCQGYLLKYLSR